MLRLSVVYTCDFRELAGFTEPITFVIGISGFYGGFEVSFKKMVSLLLTRASSRNNW